MNLTKYIAITGRWRFVPVLKEVNGKPRPEAVLIDGEARKGISGTFYLEWREEGKRIQRPCGVASREALDAWRTQAAILGGAIEAPADEDSGPLPLNVVSIKTTCDTFLAEVKATKAPATYGAYRADLEWFRVNLERDMVGKVTGEDLIKVFGKGRAQELGQATINRRVMVGLIALRNAESTMQMKKGDWPTVPETDVAIYSPEQLTTFFAACDVRERLIFQVFLMAGFRAGEVSTLRWRDIDFAHHSLAVCARPEYAFKPKSYETRRVPVPVGLIAARASVAFISVRPPIFDLGRSRFQIPIS